MKSKSIIGILIAIIIVITVAAYFSGVCFTDSSPAQTACQEGDDHCGDDHQEQADACDSESGHDHSEHAEGHSEVVHLEQSAIRQFGIEVAAAGAAKIETYSTLPAAIALDGDKKAHVSPRIAGVVQSVAKTLGEKVLAGQTLAVIHSRELADYKAGYLAAKEKQALAETLFGREKMLWEKKITAEQEYLNAQSQLADAGIELRSARQKLYALGFSQDYLEKLPNLPEQSYIQNEITAPIDGVIIDKHITTGEILSEDSEPFVIADLSQVWVDVNIHQKDLPFIKQGQEASVKTEHSQGRGVVSYVSGVVDESTKTALARIVLPNDSGQWRPGMFATVDIVTDRIECKVAVSKDAVIRVEGQSLVFVPVEGGYKAHPVQLGRTGGEMVEIVSGLDQGQQYVARGAFTLKSEMLKSTEDPCGGH